MKNLKRILSPILVLAMLISCLPMPTYAALVGTEKAKIELVVLETVPGKTANDAHLQYKEVTTKPDFSDYTEGGDGKTEDGKLDPTALINQTFMLGIVLKNFKNIEEVRDGKGIQNLDVSFTYDDSIVAPDGRTAVTGAAARMQSYADSIPDPDGEEPYENVNYYFGVEINTSQYKPATYEYTVSQDNPTEASDKDFGRKRISLSLSWSEDMPSTNPPIQLQNNDNYVIAAIPFKCTGVKPDADTVLFDFAQEAIKNGALGFGNLNSYSSYQNSDVDPDVDVNKVVEFLTTGVELFKVGGPTITSITKNTPYTLPEQILDKNLNLGNLVLKANYSEGEPVTIELSDTFLKWQYGPTGLTDATKDQLTGGVEQPLTNSVKNQYLYAVYKGHIVEVGQINLTSDYASSITVDDANSTFTGTAAAPASYFTNAGILAQFSGTGAKTLKLKVKMASAPDTETNVTYTTSGDYAIFKADSEGGALTKVVSTDKFEVGKVYYVAAASTANNTTASSLGTKVAKLNITAVADSLQINSPATAANSDLKYATAEDSTGDKRNIIDFKNVQLITKQASASKWGNATAVSTLGATNFIFYLGANNTPANNKYIPEGTTGHQTTITSGTTPYVEATHKDKYVYVVPAGLSDYSNVTPVLIGQLGTRAVAEAKTGNTLTKVNTTLEYGDTYDKVFTNATGGNAELKLTYNNGNTVTFVYDTTTKAFKSATGITLASQNVKMYAEGAEMTDPTAVKAVPGTGKKVEFKVGNTVVCDAALTINKKAVKYYVPEVSIPNKDYDTTAAIPTPSPVKAVIDKASLIAADQTGITTETIDVSGVSFAYENANVGTKAISVTTGTGTNAPTISGVTDFSNNYELSALDTTAGTKHAIKNGKVDGITGVIEAKKIQVRGALTVPAIKKDATTRTFTKAETLNASNTTGENEEDPGVLGDETVTLTFEYTYADGETPSVTVNVTGTSGTTNLGLPANSNYELVGTPTATGSYTTKTVNSIKTIAAPADQTYPNRKLNLNNVTVTLGYEEDGEDDVTMTYADFLKEGGSISFTDAEGTQRTITSTDLDEDALKESSKYALAIGTTQLTFSYPAAPEAITKTAAAKVGKKTIQLKDLTFTATKKVGVDDVKVEVEIEDGVIEEDDDIKITAKGAFDDDNAGSNKDVKITDITLSGDSADYYELEDTESTGKGTIEPGEQSAPDKVEATVDNKTNNITVTYPIGDNVQYSIDGGQTWQDSETFTGLTKGTPYTIQARYKGVEGVSEPSDATSSEEVTTYKYHVTRTKRNATKITDEIYTNLDTAQTVTEINKTIFTKAPTSFAAYYTDLPCKEKLVYPYTMQPETALYYTTSGGSGGGGGVATHAVVFSAGAHGKIVSGKSTLNITSGEVIKELPVVEANPGYKFVGWSQDGGETIINLADNPIKKATNFVAVYEEDVKPTPTPVVIPAEFTKPYASGYDGDVFLPDNNITRAELATMIARLMYGDELPNGIYRASFSDIPSDAWYSKYVGYLENFGILDGYDEDGIMVFKPEQTITRAEMATVITRAQQYAVDSADNTFWDVEADYWAAGYIATLASRNIITGYADGSFAPTNPLTRAEAVVIINRLLDPSTAIETFIPVDISRHWAENEIILAVNERQINGTGVEVAPEQEETPAPEATPEAEPTEAPAE